MTKKTSVGITLPVFNEEMELAGSVERLLEHCEKNLNNYDFTITIADNASVDATPEIGKKLSSKYKKISYKRFSEKGRGRAVKTIWQNSSADIQAYMDIDLSTNLKHLLPLVGSLVSGGYDIAIGSRLLPQSRVTERSVKREFISRMYNLLIKFFFMTRFSDAQCGFKAMTSQAARELLPHIQDNEWFMDTEMLVVGEKVGYKIYEEPVEWHDNPGSTVRVLPTAMGDLRGLVRLFVSRPWRKLRSLHDRLS